MNCLKRLQRFFSGLVIVTFFVTNTLTPFPLARAASVESPALIASFDIPEEFGKVTGIVKGSQGGSLLIHIQEAHANYDAQKNIRNILRHLSKNYGIQLVLLEGAGNKLRPGLFNFFPKEPELQREVNEKLMQAGELTGAEVFLMDQESATRPPQIAGRIRPSADNAQRATEKQDSLSVERSTLRAAEAYGVEKAEAYAKNREAFRQVFEGRKTADDFLGDLFGEWQKAAGLSMNKPLREFLNRETSFEEKRVPLADWMVFLKTVAARDLKIDLNDVLEQKDWPVLVRYFRLRSLEGKMDDTRVAQEKAAFLKDINVQLNASATNRWTDPSFSGQRTTRNEDVERRMLSVAREVEQIFETAKKRDLPAYKTRFVFERLLDELPKDFSFAPYPNLRLYIQQMILLSELDGDTLQNEITELTGKLIASLTKTEQDKQLVRDLLDYRLLTKLFHLELSRGEYEELQLAQRATVDAQRGNQKKDVARSALSVEPGIRAIFDNAVAFYAGAIERENFMMQRAREVMLERKQTKAVLVTGGFHAEGLKEKALATGSSYIEITPRIGEVSADSEKNYLEALLGAQRTAHSAQRTAHSVQRSGSRHLRGGTQSLPGSGVGSERSEIAILRAVSDNLFLREVNPKNWPRELAGVGARIIGVLQNVPEMTPGRARSAISHFLQAAATETSGQGPFIARSEVRKDSRVSELRSALTEIAEGKAGGFEFLKPSDVREYTDMAKSYLKKLKKGASPAEIAQARNSISSYQKYTNSFRGPTPKIPQHSFLNFSEIDLYGFEDFTPSQFLTQKGINLEALRGSKVYIFSKRAGIVYAITFSLEKELVIPRFLDMMAKAIQAFHMKDIGFIRAEQIIPRSETRDSGKGVDVVSRRELQKAMQDIRGQWLLDKMFITRGIQRRIASAKTLGLSHDSGTVPVLISAISSGEADKSVLRAINEALAAFGDPAIVMLAMVLEQFIDAAVDEKAGVREALVDALDFMLTNVAKNASASPSHLPPEGDGKGVLRAIDVLEKALGERDLHDLAVRALASIKDPELVNSWTDNAERVVSRSEIRDSDAADPLKKSLKRLLAALERGVPPEALEVMESFAEILRLFIDRSRATGGKRSVPSFEMEEDEPFLGEAYAKSNKKHRIYIPAKWQRPLSAGMTALLEEDANGLKRLRVYPRGTWKKNTVKLPEAPDTAQGQKGAIFSKATPLKMVPDGRVVLSSKSFGPEILDASAYKLTGEGDSFLIIPVRAEAQQLQSRSEARHSLGAESGDEGATVRAEVRLPDQASVAGDGEDPWAGIATAEERAALRDAINKEIEDQGEKIYEVNARQQFLDKQAKNPAVTNLFDAITDEDLEEVRKLGANVYYLMGIWELSEFSRKFNKAWEDPESPGRVASAFSIYDYVLNPELGDEASFMRFVIRANRKGLKIILDFVPNHMAVDSDWPNEWFMQDSRRYALAVLSLDEYLPPAVSGPNGFSRSFFEQELHLTPAFLVSDAGRVLKPAHGRRSLDIKPADSMTHSWIDTKQLNLSHPGVQAKFKEVLSYILDITNGGGVRMDMAHYMLKDHVNRNWLNPLGQKPMEEEFLPQLIAEITAQHPGALFFAESYEGKEGALQTAGMSLTYDKHLWDLVVKKEQPVSEIMDYLTRVPIEYFRRTVHFLVHHDDPNAATIANWMSPEQEMAAMAIISAAAPGALLLYQGQELRHSKGKPSANWLRPGNVEETNDPDHRENYWRLLTITRSGFFRKAEVKRLPAKTLEMADHVVAVQRKLGENYAMVLVNNAQSPAGIKYTPDITQWGIAENEASDYEWEDLLTGKTYPLERNWVLSAYEYRILVLKKKLSLKVTVPPETDSQVSLKGFEDRLWEGIHERNPDWQRMNAILEVLLEKTGISFSGILAAVTPFVRGQGLETSSSRILSLLDRLADLNLIKQEGEMITLAQSPRVVAVKADAAHYIKKELEKAVSDWAKGESGAEENLKKVVKDYAQAVALWPLYPIESRWPVLRAAALLDQVEQEALARFLNEHEKEFGANELVDSILLMLKAKPLDGWLKKYAPHLIGRTLYYFSPETVLLAGGLGRVGQFHAEAMKKLVGDDAEIVLGEPYYHFRLKADNRTEEPIDYSKLPTPVRDLKLILEFEVPVNRNSVKVKAFSGRNSDGSVVYLIDGGEYYTRLLYRYGPDNGWVPYSEFVEFFSRAAVEMAQRLEKDKQEQQQQNYKAPVLWFNDGQMGPAPAYKVMMDRIIPVLRDALTWFTTHTYRNRGWADFFKMGFIAPVWVRLFGDHDSTSVGVRSSDGASAVSAVHSYEVGPSDPFTSVVAITNGDDRETSSAVFRSIAKELFPEANVEFLTPKQIIEIKRTAKKKLSDEFGWGFDPDRIVISYSGRLVEEKAGRSRAFTNKNLRELIKAGAQILFFGNVQTNTQQMYDDLQKLAEEINRTGPGKLVVVTGWGIEDQRKLLAASDLQVQDSDRDLQRGTGAAEYTEADISANAGLQMGPPWLEGIIQKQGMILDRNRPGSGNTLIPNSNNRTSDPHKDDPGAYLDTFLWAIHTFNADRSHFASYQATSLRLSRVIEAVLTSAEYLRQFDRAVLKKDNFKKLSSRIRALVNEPQGMETLGAIFRGLTSMPKQQAVSAFGEEKLPAVMAAVAVLFPRMLGKVQMWNPEEYKILSAIISNPELKDLFELGELHFHPLHNRDDDTVNEDNMAFSRVIGERNIIFPIHFGRNFYDQENGKVWLFVRDARVVIKDPDASFHVSDWSLEKGKKVVYPARRNGTHFLKEWLVGNPVEDVEKDDSDFTQRGKGYQVLSVEKIDDSEIVRSEMRKNGIQHVLIVDDKELYREFNRLLLKEWARTTGKELTFDEASSAEEALRILEELQAAGKIPDLVLTDRQMPGMGGVGLARKIYEKSIPAKVVMVTGMLPTEIKFYNEKLIVPGILVGIAEKSDEDGIKALLDQVNASLTARSEIRDELPYGAEYRDEVKVVESNIQNILSNLAKIVDEAKQQEKPVLLRAVSMSPDEDIYLGLLGFAPLQLREKMEERMLADVVEAIRSDRNTLFRLNENGRNLTVTAGGKTWELLLNSGLGNFSKTFQDFVDNDPVGVALQDKRMKMFSRQQGMGERVKQNFLGESGRKKGIDSFGTQIKRGAVTLRDPVSVAYGIESVETLAAELALEDAKSVIITHAEYERLKTARSAEKETSETVSPSTPVSQETEALLEVLSGIRQAWNGVEEHWAFQQVSQKADVLAAWDQRFEQESVRARLENEAINEKARQTAAMQIRRAFNGETPEEIVAVLVRAPKYKDVFEERPYGKILELETFIRDFLRASAAETKDAELKKRIKRIFDAIVRLQSLVGSRTSALVRFPSENLHPEIQDFLAKDIMCMHFLQKATSAVASVRDSKLVDFAMRTLDRQSGLFSIVNKPASNEEDHSSAGSVDRDSISGAISELQELISERKGFYDGLFPGLFETASNMYGDVSSQLQELLKIEETQEFTSRLYSILNIMVSLWSSDERGLWFAGTGHQKMPVPETTRARYQNVMDRIMAPLFLNAEDVDTFVFGGKESAPERRSEVRTALDVAALPAIVEMDRFIQMNETRGGGGLQGFRGVTEKVMDGIWSLTAHTLNAAEVVASFFGGATQQKVFGIQNSALAEPQTFLEKTRLAAARSALGMNKTIAPGDAFIIRPGLAFKDGALLVKKMVFGEVPVTIYDPQGSITEAERGLLRQINGQLAGTHLPPIRVAKNLNEANGFLKADLEETEKFRGAKVTPPMRLKVMANALDPLAIELKRQYKDDALLVTSKRFRIFLELAGVAALVEKMQTEYLATARSA